MQGAWRLRGLGRGQRLVVLLVAEVATQAAAAVTELRSRACAAAAPQLLSASDLTPLDVCAWLLGNAMRAEAVQARALQQQRAAHLWRAPALRILLSTDAADRRRAAGGRSLESSDSAPPLWELTRGTWEALATVPMATGIASLDPGGGEDSVDAFAVAMPSGAVIGAARAAFLEPVVTALPTAHASRPPPHEQLRHRLAVVHGTLVRAAVAADHCRLVPEIISVTEPDGGGAAGGGTGDDGAGALDAVHESETQAEAEAEAEAEQDEETESTEREPPLRQEPTAPWRLLDAIALALRPPETRPLTTPTWPWLSVAAFGVPGQDESGPPLCRLPAPPYLLVSTHACRAARQLGPVDESGPVYALPPSLAAPRAFLWVEAVREGAAGEGGDGGGRAIILDLREAESVCAALARLGKSRTLTPRLRGNAEVGRGASVAVGLSLWMLPAGVPQGAAGETALLLASVRLSFAAGGSPMPASADAASPAPIPRYPRVAATHVRFFSGATDFSAAEVASLMQDPGGPGAALAPSTRTAAFAALARVRMLDRPLAAHTPLAAVLAFEDAAAWVAVAGPVGRAAVALRAVYGSLRRAFAACVLGRPPTGDAEVQTAVLAAAGVSLSSLAALCVNPVVIAAMPHPTKDAVAGVLPPPIEPTEALAIAAHLLLGRRGGGANALVTWPEATELLSLCVDAGGESAGLSAARDSEPVLTSLMPNMKAC